MKGRHTVADILEGIWRMIQAVLLLMIMLTGLYLFFEIGCPFLFTVPVLAIYLTVLSLKMLRLGFHVMICGYYERD